MSSGSPTDSTSLLAADGLSSRRGNSGGGTPVGFHDVENGSRANPDTLHSSIASERERTIRRSGSLSNIGGALEDESRQARVNTVRDATTATRNPRLQAIIAGIWNTPQFVTAAIYLIKSGGQQAEAACNRFSPLGLVSRSNLLLHGALLLEL